MRSDSKERWEGHEYLHPHCVNVDLLVEIVEESDSLNDHSVDLVGGEFELEPVKRAIEYIRQWLIESSRTVPMSD